MSAPGGGPPSPPVDVVIVGGGPGGSVCAARLVQRGLSVVVLEKERFPRFHLGESLLPQSMPVLKELGVFDELASTFLFKYGARFHDDIQNRKDRFPFENAWRGEEDHAFEVPRDTFDHVLLKHAAKLGADVREGWTMTGAIREGDRIVGVEATSPDGAKHTLMAKFVVDASGRDALFAHEARTTTKIDGLDQTALFAQFTGVPRQPGKLEGDIDIVLFRDSEADRPNWFWFIPFKDGRTSVGAVVSRAWMKERRALTDGSPSGLFAQAVKESKTATELLASAKCLWDEKRATADFSYRVRALYGEGWITVGDAGGFIDPLFSTGAHLAMTGGIRAADLIADHGGAPPKEALEAWSTELRKAAETFILAVRAFYAGPLVDLLFAENKHEVLRKSVTSLLAGDVWVDAVWLRDARSRITAMLKE